MEDIILPYDPSKEMETKNETTVKIIIHVFQRTSRKYITKIENLDYYIDYIKDLDEFLKIVKKRCSCNGNKEIKIKNNKKFKNEKEDSESNDNSNNSDSDDDSDNEYKEVLNKDEIVINFQGNQKEKIFNLLKTHYKINKNNILLRGL